MLPQTHLENYDCQHPNQQNTLKEPNINAGKWTNQENLKYAIFMDFHKVTLSSRQKKKNFRVFEEMAAFIGSRNTVQCRSHHQKLEERFKHFKKIISAVKNEVGRKQYKVQFKKWTNSGQDLVFVEPQIKENPEICSVQAKKEVIPQEIVDRQMGANNQEIVFNPPVYPFFAYPSFQHLVAYSMPNIYPFTTQYY